MAKEKEAEEANGEPAQAAGHGGNGQSEWTQLPQASDRPSTLGREIPVLPNKR